MVRTFPRRMPRRTPGRTARSWRPSPLPLSRRIHRPGRGAAAVAAAIVVVLAAAACGRPAGQQETGAGTGTTAAPSAAASATASAGDFGTEKAICGPGTAHGGTGRGVTSSTITVGVTSDAGSTITPGLGQEFFDVGDAFVAWCNQAGGINGRKLKLVKHDAKLTDAAAQMITACRSDFMLVGGGMVGDAAAVKPRLACDLAQIPAYSVSPEALAAGLQVRPNPNPPSSYPVGPFRAMAKLYPDAMSHLGVGGSSYATIRSQGLRLREALTQSGYTVTDYQEWPPLVANFRPFMEEMKGKGVQGFQPIGIQDVTPMMTAMNNVGMTPKFVIIANQLYDPSTIQAAKSVAFPAGTYLTLDHLPFELGSQSPVVKQAIDLLHATKPDAKLTDFTALGFNAWTLWAKSATACGDNLTSQCVLGKAGATTDWSAGGLYPPRDLTGPGKLNDCFLLMKVTKSGFVYDKNATQPNRGFFNCAADNVATLTNTFD